MRNVLRVILAGLWAIRWPVIVLLAGGRLMGILSGQDYVDRLRDRAPVEHRTSLNMRPLGYDTGAAARHWGLFDERAVQSERTFLQLDLAFPLFYGAALAAALWQAWKAVGRPFLPAWAVVALAAVTVIADWTENLIHLSQLERFVQGGQDALQPAQIGIASLATTIKILFFAGVLVLTAILGGWKAAERDEVPSSERR